MKINPCLILFAAFISISAAAQAEEDLACEVMSVAGEAYRQSAEGSFPIKEGDILKESDVIVTKHNGSVDVAFDAEWQNVARIDKNSEVTLESIYPSSLSMENGSVYAKLKALPRESTFEVITPTAVASVRGTEYLTEVLEDGSTDVMNYSDSEVTVFGIERDGKIAGEALKLRRAEKTGPIQRGMRPHFPQRMNENEMGRARERSEKIEQRMKSFKEAGRVGKIQKVHEMKERHERRMDRSQAGRPDGNHGGRRLQPTRDKIAERMQERRGQKHEKMGEAREKRMDRRENRQDNRPNKQDGRQNRPQRPGGPRQERPN